MRQNSIHLIALLGLVASGLALPGAAFAQSGLQLEVTSDVDCDQVNFTLEVAGGSGVHDVTFDFGDGDTVQESDLSSFPVTIAHTYLGSGEYTWTALAVDVTAPELTGTAQGTVAIGPTVTLNSDPFPPLLTLSEGSAELSFSGEVEGGAPPYSFAWDLDGDGNVDGGADAGSSEGSFNYTGPGTYEATVTVTDDCGLTTSDTLVVVVFDPEDACHPRAQQIAEAVSSLFPGQAEQLYSCEDIFGIFTGDLTGSQLGFGRMWHAYQMALTIEELTWEEILDWHLEGSGWGLLVQLDRFAEEVSEIGVRDLVTRVLEGEATINEIRTAVRSAVRYEADFEDALARLQEGASPGELGQFYRLAQDLDMDPEMLDGYLESGLSISEVKNAARVAARYASDLDTIIEARSNGASWGELGQAFKLADDEHSAEEILEMGVKAFRDSQRETERDAREAEREARRQEREEAIREREVRRLSDRYQLSEAEAAALFEACNWDKKCVRDQLRAEEAVSRDERTVAKLADQYGVSEAEVLQIYGNECSQNWSCVRQHLRDQARGERGNGKGKDK